MHARIAIDDEGVQLTYSGPRSGTFVNDSELLTPTRPAPPPLAVGPREPELVPGVRAAPKAAATAGSTMPHVDELLGARTKTKARHAPLAVLVKVVYAVLLYLSTPRC